MPEQYTWILYIYMVGAAVVTVWAITGLRMGLGYKLYALVNAVVCTYLFFSGTEEVVGWKHNLYAAGAIFSLAMIVLILLFDRREEKITGGVWLFAMVMSGFNLWLLFTG